MILVIIPEDGGYVGIINDGTAITRQPVAVNPDSDNLRAELTDAMVRFAADNGIELTVAQVKVNLYLDLTVAVA